MQSSPGILGQVKELKYGKTNKCPEHLSSSPLLNPVFHTGLQPKVTLADTKPRINSGARKTQQKLLKPMIQSCAGASQKKRKGRSPVTRGEKSTTSQSSRIPMEPTAPGLPQACVCILSQRERGRIFFFWINFA